MCLGKIYFAGNNENYGGHHINCPMLRCNKGLFVRSWPSVELQSGRSVVAQFLGVFVLELSILADRRELCIYEKEGVKYFYERGSMFLLNTLNAELNPIYLLLALLEAHHILHVSSVRVNYMACKGHA